MASRTGVPACTSASPRCTLAYVLYTLTNNDQYGKRPVQEPVPRPVHVQHRQNRVNSVHRHRQNRVNTVGTPMKPGDYRQYTVGTPLDVHQLYTVRTLLDVHRSGPFTTETGLTPTARDVQHRRAGTMAYTVRGLWPAVQYWRL